jgi:hypothetical protein
LRGGDAGVTDGVGRAAGADGGIADQLRGFAPDLLRWQLPRVLGGFTTLATDVDYVLLPDGPVSPERIVLVVRSPSAVLGSQRLLLDAVPLDTWVVWTSAGRALRIGLTDAAGQGGQRPRLTVMTVRWSERSRTTELPRLYPALLHRPADLELVRRGLLAPDDLHPLLRDVLCPAVAGGVPKLEDFDWRGSGPVRVRCGGAWHPVEIRLATTKARRRSRWRSRNAGRDG